MEIKKLCVVFLTCAALAFSQDPGGGVKCDHAHETDCCLPEAPQTQCCDQSTETPPANVRSYPCLGIGLITSVLFVFAVGVVCLLVPASGD